MACLFYIELFFPTGPQPCDTKVDICLLVDASSSITYYNPSDNSLDNWLLQLQFLSQLVDLFKIGPDDTRVGAIVFSDDVHLEFSLDTYTNAISVKNAIMNIRYLNQGTNTEEAFIVAREQCFNFANGDRQNIQNLAIIISDGRPEPFPEPAAVAAAQALKDTGAIVLAIGVTSRIDKTFLQDISSPPQIENENYFTTADFSTLGTIRREVSAATCEAITGKSLLFHFRECQFIYSVFVL